MRVALYWTPCPSDPLHAAGSAWLGRDAEVGVAVRQPAVEGIAGLTAAARVYGFHATLRPPMRLATGWAEFLGAAHRVAAAVAPFRMPRLVVDEMGGFLALREAEACPALWELADACVAGTDVHRLRAGAAELASRRAAGLSAMEDALLLRWGYPYVMEAWRFHVTLSGRLAGAEMARVRAAAARHFTAALAVERRVSEISVCTQADGGDFLVAERVALKGGI